MNQHATFLHIGLSLCRSLTVMAALAIGQNAYAQTAVEGCIKQEPHEHISFLLVDKTDTLTDPQNLKQTFSSVKESVRPGERLVVGAIGAKGTDTRVMIDITRPQSSIWESTMKIRAKEKVFTDCLQKAEVLLTQPSEAKKTSAILETLSFLGTTLTSDQSKSKRAIVFSDMIQNSDALSFYAAKTVDPDASMKSVEKATMVWPLAGVEFYVAGVGGNFSDEKARKVEQFWRKYFEKAGAQLKLYGPVFLGVGN